MSGSWQSETCIKRANLNVEWPATWLIRCRISKLCYQLKCRIADRKDGMWIFSKNSKRKYRILVGDITPYFRTVNKSCGPLLREIIIVGLRTGHIEQWLPLSVCSKRRKLHGFRIITVCKNNSSSSYCNEQLTLSINSLTCKANLKDSHSLLRIIIIRNPTSKNGFEPEEYS